MHNTRDVVCLRQILDLCDQFSSKFKNASCLADVRGMDQLARPRMSNTSPYLKARWGRTRGVGKHGGMLVLAVMLVASLVAGIASSRQDAGADVVSESVALGGSGNEASRGLFQDPATGDIFHVGVTDSADFPVTSGFDPYPGTATGSMFFVAKYTSALQLQWSRLIGSSSSDRLAGAAWNPVTNQVVLVGSTTGTDYPTTDDAAEPVKLSPSNRESTILTSVNPDGSIAYSTYWSASGTGHARMIGFQRPSINSLGQIAITGQSNTVINRVNSSATHGGNWDQFVVVHDTAAPAGSKVLFAGPVVNGSGYDGRHGLWDSGLAVTWLDDSSFMTGGGSNSTLTTTDGSTYRGVGSQGVVTRFVAPAASPGMFTAETVSYIGHPEYARTDSFSIFNDGLDADPMTGEFTTWYDGTTVASLTSRRTPGEAYDNTNEAMLLRFNGDGTYTVERNRGTHFFYFGTSADGSEVYRDAGIARDGSELTPGWAQGTAVGVYSSDGEAPQRLVDLTAATGSSGSSTGVVTSAQGDLCANVHVPELESYFRATIEDGGQLPASLWDANRDVAIVCVRDFDYQPLSINLGFSPSTARANEPVRLWIDITNPNAEPTVGTMFSMPLPDGITVAGTPDVISTCPAQPGTMTGSAAPGSTSVSLVSSIGYAGATRVPAGETCTVSVLVVASNPGTYEAASPYVPAAWSVPDIPAGFASAPLTVLDAPASGGVSGNVFIDENSDGTIGTGERGYRGAVITAFDDAGAVVATAISNKSGDYTLSVPDGVRVRIEARPATEDAGWIEEGYAGGTSVQFATAPAAINFSFNDPQVHCSLSSPDVITPCYSTLDPITGQTNEPGLVTTPSSVGTTDVRNSSDTSPGIYTDSHPLMVPWTETGATWGTAYDPGQGLIYSAAFAKTASHFGPGGPGAVYVTDASAATSVLGTFDAGVDTQIAYPTNGFGNPANAASANPTIVSIFDEAHKIGLGGLEVARDGSELYAINLFDRTLSTMSTADGAVSSIVPIPGTPDSGVQVGVCAPQDVRPFAASNYRNKVYVGAVCSAESTQDASQLEAYIFEYDPAVDAFAADPVFTQNIAHILNERCIRWSSEGCGGLTPWANSTSVAVRQLSLSDITFESDDNIVLAFRDRWSDGFTNASGATLVRACDADDDFGGWVLETNGSCGPTTGQIQGLSNQSSFISGGLFYGWDAMVTLHPSLTLGSTELLPASDEMLVTAYDNMQTRFFNTGWWAYDVNSGVPIRSFTLFERGPHDDTVYTVGKQAGIGEFSAMCDVAPVEIGNRIWLDADADGIQDPSEMPLGGVTVNLYDAAGHLIATTVTDTDGNWNFNSSVDDIDFDQDYEVRLDNDADYQPGGPLAGLTLSDANADDSDGGDLRDSDAQLVGGIPRVSVHTGAAGENNQSIDIGFTEYDLAVVKVVDHYDADTAEITWIARVQNQAGVPSGEIVVEDTLPPGTEFVSADNDGVHDSGTVTWTIENLPPGASLDLRVVSRIIDRTQNPFVNAVAIVGDSGQDSDSDPDDANEPVIDREALEDASIDDEAGDTDDHDIAVLDINRMFNLSLEKTLTSAGPFELGDEVSFELIPFNDGPDEADAGWSVTEVLPDGLALVSMQGEGYECSGFTCLALDELGAAQTGHPIVVTAAIVSGPGGYRKNVAFVAPSPSDPKTETNVLSVPSSNTDTSASSTDNDAQATLVVEGEELIPTTTTTSAASTTTSSPVSTSTTTPSTDTPQTTTPSADPGHPTTSRGSLVVPGAPRGAQGQPSFGGDTLLGAAPASVGTAVGVRPQASGNGGLALTGTRGAQVLLLLGVGLGLLGISLAASGWNRRKHAAGSESAS